MLTSDDPPIQNDKAARVRIRPGPATPVGRATAPLRRAIGFVPALGRRLIRVGDDPSRLQLIGMWTTGSAIVAGTGLAVAAVLGGAPPALTQPFERLAVLPGIVDGPSHQDDTVSSADKAAPDGQAGDRGRISAVSGSNGSSYSGPSAGSRTVVYPEDLIPGRSIVPQAPSGGGGTGQPAPPAGGGTGSTTAPAPGDPTPPPTQDPAPPVDPVPPTDNPTDPAVDPAPTDNPTDPAPTDPPPTEPASTDTPPAQPPTTDPPAADPPAADPQAADQPVDTPPAGPAPTPDPGQVTPAP
jgi:hypothetical protein